MGGAGPAIGKGGCHMPMKAKSELLRDAGAPGARSRTAGGSAKLKRLPHAERKAQILATAAEFFAENGLTAQTRRLADECGVSQRLLYRFFPTKEILLEAVYKKEILGSFEMSWFAGLQDRGTPVEERLNAFYAEYMSAVLTRRWLRLFLYASLAEAGMAPDYISAVITQLMEVIVREVAAEKGMALPDEKAALHEMGWTLHGAISHYAIRRRLYQTSEVLPEDKVIAMHVRTFIAGFDSMLQDYLDHLD
jgi:AcrR family transcriptional regulator